MNDKQAKTLWCLIETYAEAVAEEVDCGGGSETSDVVLERKRAFNELDAYIDALKDDE